MASQSWSEASRGRARARAVAFLSAQNLEARRIASGDAVGIQATLAMEGAAEGLDLYAVTGVSGVIDDSGREVLAKLERKLGFPLEPELFSNMLFVAYLGADAEPAVRALCRPLLATFRDRHEAGLYHFFLSLCFACDIDCTGVAARARLVSGDIDLTTREGAASLRPITDSILRSAAVCDVPAKANVSHGKANGALQRHVFKVYLDDHRVQGPECDRGLKVNPVVVSNALYPLLLELKHGHRALDERVQLEEYVQGVEAPRRGEARVLELITANVRYVTDHLDSGRWRDGCRYYPSPDAFLCSHSENVRALPEVFDALGSPARMRAAIHERRAVAAREPTGEAATSLSTAFRAIAAMNLGLDPADELDRLVARQGPTGAWTDADGLYSFGSSGSLPLVFRSNLLTTAFAVRALGEPAAVPHVAAPARAWAEPLLVGARRSGSHRVESLDDVVDVAVAEGESA